MPEQFIPVCEPLLGGNESKYVNDALSTGWISSAGKYVQEFEAAFARYCGVKHGVAVCNGTVALHVGLVSLGIGPGDEVIVPDFTMIASAFAVCYTGARPVFVDAKAGSWNIDAERIAEKMTSRTKAIMPVHVFGLPCDMDTIGEIARDNRLAILEDAAEAHGAEYRGRRTGSMSNMASFSFFANKNLTTGEGGMVVTDDPELWTRVRYHKNLCFSLDAPRDYRHEDIGFNYRMSNLHAAIGLAQVERADVYRDLRIRNGLLYRQGLADVPGVTLQSHDESVCSNVYWMNGLLVDPKAYGRSRDELTGLLRDKGIETRKFFNGMHRQHSLAKYGADCSGAYPVSDQLADNGFYLPSGSGLTPRQIEFICDTVKSLRR